MKPVLILKFPYASQYGGGERHTLLLADEIVRRKGRVFFAGSCAVLRKEFRRRQLPVLRWWAGKEPVSIWSLILFPFTMIPAFLGLLVLVVYFRIVKNVKTLYCLSLTEKVLITPLAWVIGMRVLWMEHVSTDRWLSKNPFRPLYALWSRCATVLVVSRHVSEKVQALGVPAAHSAVVYNGIDVRPYQDFHRRTFHWTQQFVIGTVARLEEEKGINFLLHAFQKFLPIVPHARLVIVGEGSQRQQLEWLAKRLTIDHAVQWVGMRPNISGLMKSFDLFVLPSVGRESFGVVLLEAMAASCPVIASNLGGIPEVVKNNRTGILVEPGDSELLMQAIAYVYRHPDIAMQLATAGHTSAIQEFTLSQSLDRLLTFFP